MAYWRKWRNVTLKGVFLHEKSMKTGGKAINYEQPLLARPFYLNPRTRNAKSKDGFCHTESFNKQVQKWNRCCFWLCLGNPKKSGFLCRVLLLIINVSSHFMKALNSAYFIDARKNHLDILLVCIASLPMKWKSWRGRPSLSVTLST